MTAITVTPRPDTAQVAIEVTPAAGTTVTAVVRADANGARPVRVVPGQLPASGAFALVDDEAALTGPITYTVADGAAGASAATELGVGGYRLTLPVAPAWSEVAELITGYSAERVSTTTVHQVIDRPDPLLALGELAPRRGSLDVRCASYAHARGVEAVYNRGEVVLLRQAPFAGMDMYHAAIRTRLEPHANPQAREWTLTVDYQEVAYPVGDRVGTLGWDINDATSSAPTVSALAVAWPTVNALTVGA